MAGTVFLEKIKSESLSHLSYIVGQGGQAAVVDPRRDCEEYVDIAHRNGARITHIFETHRNEDYVKGNAPILERLPTPPPMSPDRFSEAMEAGMLALDLRSPEAFAGAFVPGSLAVPLAIVPAYGGYFLDYDRPVGLIPAGDEDIETAVRYLIRMGYDRIAGFLTGGLQAWETSGRPYDRIAAVHVDQLSRRLREKEDFTLLDVREEEELRKLGKFPGSTHIFLGELPRRLNEISRDKPVTTFCGSGKRAIVVASILKQNGFGAVEDSLGSMAACMKAGCPIEKTD